MFWVAAHLYAFRGEEPYRTDEGNFIIDLHLKRIANPQQTSLVLNQIPGVVENGLFLDICDIIVIGNGDGTVEVRNINDGTVEREKIEILEGDNLFNLS
jgi:ribose 5-phosphate isomerase A